MTTTPHDQLEDADHETRVRRIVAVAAALTFLVLQAAVHSSIHAPSSAKPAQELADYFTDRASTVGALALVTVLAEMAFFVFVITATALVHRRFDPVALATLVFGSLAAIWGTLAVLPDATATLLARQDGGLHPATARTLFNLHQVIGGPLLLSAALFVGALSWVLYRHSSLVLIIFSGLVCLSMAANGAARFLTSTHVDESGLSRIHHFHDLTFAPWVVIVAISLWRGPGAPVTGGRPRPSEVSGGITSDVL